MTKAAPTRDALRDRYKSGASGAAGAQALPSYLTGTSLSLLGQPANDRNHQVLLASANANPGQGLLNSLAYNPKMSPKF